MKMNENMIVNFINKVTSMRKILVNIFETSMLYILMSTCAHQQPDSKEIKRILVTKKKTIIYTTKNVSISIYQTFLIVCHFYSLQCQSFLALLSTKDEIRCRGHCSPFEIILSEWSLWSKTSRGFLCLLIRQKSYNTDGYSSREDLQVACRCTESSDSQHHWILRRYRWGLWWGQIYWNCCHQGDGRQQEQVRMGDRPCALLVGMWVGVATAEKSMEVPQRIMAGTVMQSSGSLLGVFLKETQSPSQEGVCTLMLL